MCIYGKDKLHVDHPIWCNAVIMYSDTHQAKIKSQRPGRTSGKSANTLANTGLYLERTAQCCTERCSAAQNRPYTGSKLVDIKAVVSVLMIRFGTYSM
jgi:hypothetical protein